MAKSEASKERNRTYMRVRYVRKRDELITYINGWQANNREKAAYYFQKSSARRRQVPFLLTFDEWWAIWQESGKWEQHGRSNEQFCMARYRDQGPYAVGNVRICTCLENQLEKVWGPETRKRMSEAAKRRHRTRTL
jgi:hypothetical protein